MPIYITILPFAPVFQRGISGEFAEHFSKITAAAQSAGLPDKGDWLRGACEQLAGILETVSFQIFCRRYMEAVLKYTKAFAHADKSR